MRNFRLWVGENEERRKIVKDKDFKSFLCENQSKSRESKNLKRKEWLEAKKKLNNMKRSEKACLKGKRIAHSFFVFGNWEKKPNWIRNSEREKSRMNICSRFHEFKETTTQEFSPVFTVL